MYLRNKVLSGYMPKSRIAGAYGNSIFSFLRNLNTVFHSGYTNLHSHQWCKRILFFPHLLQHLLFISFLIMVILSSVRWYLFIVLIGMSLIMRNDEPPFMCLFALGFLFCKLLVCASPIFLMDLLLVCSVNFQELCPIWMLISSLL